MGTTQAIAFPYAQVEAALASLFGAGATVQSTSFRARIKHFQKLGLPIGLSPGKGQRIDYSYDKIHQWLIALEMAEVGIDPAVATEMITKYWKTLGPWLERATDKEALAGNSVYLTFRPQLMSGTWEFGSRKNRFSTLPRFGIFRRYDQRGRKRQENMSLILDWLDDNPQRVVIINLTGRVGALNDALNSHSD